MLTPAQAAEFKHAKPDNAKEQAQLEAHIDERLSFGFRRLFPSASYERANIKAVLDKYRAAGWTIDEDGVEWTFRDASAS